MGQSELNSKVTGFLDSLNHALRAEIECLRNIIMSTDYELTEGIKWNGPNYSINGKDRITMRINPQKQIQVIFHRGAKVKEPLKERLLSGQYDILGKSTLFRTLFKRHRPKLAQYVGSAILKG